MVSAGQWLGEGLEEPVRLPDDWVEGVGRSYVAGNGLADSAGLETSCLGDGKNAALRAGYGEGGAGHSHDRGLELLSVLLPLADAPGRGFIEPKAKTPTASPRLVTGAKTRKPPSFATIWTSCSASARPCGVPSSGTEWLRSRLMSAASGLARTTWLKRINARPL